MLCYTGEADGAYAGAIAKWKDAGELFTSIARWTAGETNTLPGNLLVTEELRNGVAVVQPALDRTRARVRCACAVQARFERISRAR